MKAELTVINEDKLKMNSKVIQLEDIIMEQRNFLKREEEVEYTLASYELEPSSPHDKAELKKLTEMEDDGSIPESVSNSIFE